MKVLRGSTVSQVHPKTRKHIRLVDVTEEDRLSGMLRVRPLYGPLAGVEYDIGRNQVNVNMENPL